MQTQKKSYFFEAMTLLLYAVALIFIMYYHEPWFDEAQAWLIARDATIREILTSITHYEGHPPIWFLILMPFAKLGVPFELGVKTVNFIIATIAMGIFIFKAPFKRIVRLTIPFTYFFFYQYGVISRPYSLMMLGFALSAVCYKQRNQKPFRFAAALSLICSSGAFGMAIAAGISIAWLFEVIGTKLSMDNFVFFMKSKIFYALLVLLTYNILLLILIYPYNDTYAINIVKQNLPIPVFLLALFVMPSFSMFFVENNAQSPAAISDLKFVAYIFMSIIINVGMYVLARKVQKRALFVLPYLLFTAFWSFVYFWPHHIGILTLFYTFLLWCFFDEMQTDTQNSETIRLEFYKKWLGYAGNMLLFLSITTSIYWSVCASINDIYLNYGAGREAAKFIKDNGLHKLNILVDWSQKTGPKSVETPDDYNHTQGVPALAYFDNNIFCNFNKKQSNKCYLSHKVATDGSYVKQLIQNQYPDVLFGGDPKKSRFIEYINLDDYALVKSIHGNNIWKSTTYPNRQFIFIRKDLLQKYPHFEVLNREDEMIKDKETGLSK